jgi:hypothetical protein
MEIGAIAARIRDRPGTWARVHLGEPAGSPTRTGAADELPRRARGTFIGRLMHSLSSRPTHTPSAANPGPEWLFTMFRLTGCCRAATALGGRDFPVLADID